MLNFMRILFAVAILFSISGQAFAIKPFYVQFVEMYAGEESEASDEFKELVNDKKNKCLICHQGKKKKNRNPYGVALGELLTKKDKQPEKIIEALKAVADQSSDPDNEEAPTFGELIAEGKLPGGTFEECKEEPEN